MKRIKHFFKIEEKYKFEWNDLRALLQTINVILLFIIGYSVAWFGLAVAAFGLIKDLTTDRRINGILMHTSTIIMNLYFLSRLYS